jgi:hypothetical protein
MAASASSGTATSPDAHECPGYLPIRKPKAFVVVSSSGKRTIIMLGE